MHPTLTPETFLAIMRKAKSLLLNKKYQEALDVITLIQEDVDHFLKFGEERMLVFFNNVAALYFLLRKPHLCSFYLNKALEVSLFHVFRRNPNDINIKERQIFHSNSIYKVMYNMGLCTLYMMKPVKAFGFFKKAVQGMHRSPLVWLRLAECCIMAYKQGNEGVFNYHERLVNGKIGDGLASIIVLNNKLFKDSAFSNECQALDGAEPDLGYATICLKNSFLLLPLGNSKLRQAVLTASSYVHLTIGNPVNAHKYARMLFSSSSFHVYKYLSKLYLAESLVLLNRFQEAIDILRPLQFDDWDYSEDPQVQKWHSDVQVTSQVVLDYNLAVALVMMGEFHKASELLRNLWRLKGAINGVPVHIIALLLYIELVLGHIDVAKIIIKRNCPFIFNNN